MKVFTVGGPEGTRVTPGADVLDIPYPHVLVGGTGAGEKAAFVRVADRDFPGQVIPPILYEAGLVFTQVRGSLMLVAPKTADQLAKQGVEPDPSCLVAVRVYGGLGGGTKWSSTVGAPCPYQGRIWTEVVAECPNDVMVRAPEPGGQYETTLYICKKCGARGRDDKYNDHPRYGTEYEPLPSAVELLAVGRKMVSPGSKATYQEALVRMDVGAEFRINRWGAGMAGTREVRIRWDGTDLTAQDMEGSVGRPSGPSGDANVGHPPDHRGGSIRVGGGRGPGSGPGGGGGYRKDEGGDGGSSFNAWNRPSGGTGGGAKGRSTVGSNVGDPMPGKGDGRRQRRAPGKGWNPDAGQDFDRG